MMAISGGADAMLKVTDLEKGEVITKVSDPMATDEISAKTVTSLDADLDAKKAVVGTAVPSLKVVDLEVGKHMLGLKGHTDQVRGARADWDLNAVVSAAWDGMVHVYDIRASSAPSSQNHWSSMSLHQQAACEL